MGQAEEDQPAVSAVVPGGFGFSLAPDAVGEEHDPRPEQDGKQAHELFVGEDLGEQEGGTVQSFERPKGDRVEVENPRQAKGNHVHHQDAQEGDASEDIELSDAVCSGDRRLRTHWKTRT